jgi:hypothetical protein
MVTEVQGRKALHGHLLLWSTVSPHLFQAAAAFPAIVGAMTNLLDSMIISDLPGITHAKAMLHIVTPAAERPYRPRATTLEPIIPLDADSTTRMIERVHAVTNANNIHGHSATCAKGNSGKCGCRMGFEVPILQNTRIVELITGPGMELTCRSPRPFHRPSKEANDYSRFPFRGSTNNGLITVELARPKTKSIIVSDGDDDGSRVQATGGPLIPDYCMPCRLPSGKRPAWAFPMVTRSLTVTAQLDSTVMVECGNEPASAARTDQQLIFAASNEGNALPVVTLSEDDLAELDRIGDEEVESMRSKLEQNL